jgi:hypothetical protein
MYVPLDPAARQIADSMEEPLPIAIFTHGGGSVVCDLD